MAAYHDREWGFPMHDDRALFELLILEGAQAGLSWSTILKRREGYRRAFANFEIQQVANFDERDVERLLADTGIIRNRQKILSAIVNARQVLNVQEECGSFDAYVWSFVDGTTIDHRFTRMDQIPATTPESETMSKALKKRGFGFVGPTICYAFMQSAGLVNDHLLGCFARA
ncbi:MAG: DNA-3-methyladenine glycosylase I [Chloroflexi bacterium]|nr:DNA-3-methyladenine glycosylase I [Chloroflexota bacterium]